MSGDQDERSETSRKYRRRFGCKGRQGGGAAAGEEGAETEEAGRGPVEGAEGEHEEEVQVVETEEADGEAEKTNGGEAAGAVARR